MMSVFFFQIPYVDHVPFPFPRPRNMRKVKEPEGPVPRVMDIGVDQPENLGATNREGIRRSRFLTIDVPNSHWLINRGACLA